MIICQKDTPADIRTEKAVIQQEDIREGIRAAGPAE